MNGIHEVTGSIPVWSTISKLLIPKDEIGHPHTVSRTACSCVYAFVNLDCHRGFEADVPLAKDDLVAHLPSTHERHAGTQCVGTRVARMWSRT